MQRLDVHYVSCFRRPQFRRERAAGFLLSKVFIFHNKESSTHCLIKAYNTITDKLMEMQRRWLVTKNPGRAPGVEFSQTWSKQCKKLHSFLGSGPGTGRGTAADRRREIPAPDTPSGITASRFYCEIKIRVYKFWDNSKKYCTASLHSV